MQRWALTILRALLGYHTLGHNQSALAYGRDVLSGPLRELERVLVAVRSGQFLPDSTRSGRWLQHSPGTASSDSSALPGSKSWQLVDKPAPPGSPSSSSSSSSDSSEAASDSDDGDEEKVVGAAHFVELVLGKAFLSVVENKGSRLLHILNGNSVRLLCGRSYGKNFRAVSDLAGDSDNFCRTCFPTGCRSVLQSWRICVCCPSHAVECGLH